MTSIAPILQGLQSLKTAADIVKYIRTAEGSFEKAEIKMKVADLAEALADARLSILEAQQEIERLNAEIAELRVVPDIQADIETRDGVYFRKSEGPSGAPFCPSCYAKLDKRIPVSTVPRDFQDMAKYHCPSCRVYF
jgi:hypothetical protein